MKNSALTMTIAALLIAFALAAVAFVIYLPYEAKKTAARQAEAERKEWRADQLKKIETSLSDKKNKHALIIDEIERKAKSAKELAIAEENLIKSKISLRKSQTDLIVARLQGELQLKLRLVSYTDPVEREAKEKELEKYIAETKTIQDKHEKYWADEKAESKNQ